MSIVSWVPGATGLFAFDQRTHRRNVAQANFDHVAVDGGDRAAHQALSRLAHAGETIGFDRLLQGEFARRRAIGRTPEDVALNLADPKFADQLKIVMGFDALGRGIHAQAVGERDDGANDRRVAIVA